MTTHTKLLSVVLLAATLGCGKDPTAGDNPARAAADRTPDTSGAAPGWPEDQANGQLTSDSMAAAIARLPSCGSSAELRPGGVGPLEAGMSVAELLAKCPDALRTWEFEEGISYPSLAVRLGGALFVASFEDSQSSTASFRISTSDPLARTAEGLGPQSSFGALKAALGEPRFEVAECAMFALFGSKPSIVWNLEFPAGWNCEQLGDLLKPSGRRPPDSMRVHSVRLIPRKGA